MITAGWTPRAVAFGPGLGDGLGTGRGRELGEDGRDVIADRLVAQPQVVGDSGVLVAAGDQFENLALTFGQAREGRRHARRQPAADGIKHAAGNTCPQHGPAAGDRHDRPRDVIGGGLLEEIAAGPGAQGSEQRVIVLAHREDEHGDGRMAGHQAPRRLDAAQAGHGQIHQHDFGMAGGDGVERPLAVSHLGA